MKTHMHKPFWQRIETWLIAAAIIALLLFVRPHRAAGLDAVAAAPFEGQVPFSVPAAPATHRLPLTMDAAVSYFSTVLEMSPERVSDHSVAFENQQVVHPEDRWRILVSAVGKEVVVEFRVGGDFGMNLAREFFESPLFERAESEKLYEMLNDAMNNPAHQFDRFAVRMQLRATTDLYYLTLRFLPLNAA